MCTAQSKAHPHTAKESARKGKRVEASMQVKVVWEEVQGQLKTQDNTRPTFRDSTQKQVH